MMAGNFNPAEASRVIDLRVDRSKWKHAYGCLHSPVHRGAIRRLYRHD